MIFLMKMFAVLSAMSLLTLFFGYLSFGNSWIFVRKNSKEGCETLFGNTDCLERNAVNVSNVELASQEHVWNKGDWIKLHQRHGKRKSDLGYSYFVSFNVSGIGFKRHVPCGKNLKVIVGVISAPNNFEHRKAIRETWASELPKIGAKAFFFLGETSTKSIKGKLKTEQTKYKDLIQANFVDHYYNLTMKSVLLLKWAASFCPTAEFLVKTDDDVFVNSSALQEKLSSVSLGNLYGYVYPFPKPITSVKLKRSKWYIQPLVYPWEYYPPYINGPFYYMSVRTADILYRASLSVPMFFLEDIYVTGMLSTVTGTKVNHVDSVATYLTSNSCCGILANPSNSVAEIRTKFKIFKSKNFKCRRIFVAKMPLNKNSRRSYPCRVS